MKLAPLMVLLVLSFLVLPATSAQVPSEAIPLYTLENCQTSDAGPVPGAHGDRFAPRESRVECYQSAPYLSVSCTLTPPRERDIRFTAICNQRSDSYGSMEYGCNVGLPQDGWSEWTCGETYRGRIRSRWTWYQPVAQ
jgi:hypothetical protein